MAYVSVDRKDSAPADPVEPTVTLRDETRADGSHLALWAYLDTAGRLHIDGQDLGPVTRSVSGDGEYEYFKMVAREDIPRLIELLAGKPEDDILGLLAKSWTGDKSYELEEILREGPIEVELGDLDRMKENRMKVLVATKKTQGQKPGDYSDTPEGELVTFGSNSDEYVDETLNKPKSEWKKKTKKSKKYDTAMVGVTSGKATTTVLVAEVDITEDKLARLVGKSLDVRGWRETMGEKRFRKWIDQDVKDITKIANDFPTGTVLEKKKDTFFEREVID